MGMNTTLVLRRSAEWVDPGKDGMSSRSVLDCSSCVKRYEKFSISPKSLVNLEALFYSFATKQKKSNERCEHVSYYN